MWCLLGGMKKGQQSAMEWRGQYCSRCATNFRESRDREHPGSGVPGILGLLGFAGRIEDKFNFIVIHKTRYAVAPPACTTVLVTLFIWFVVFLLLLLCANSVCENSPRGNSEAFVKQAFGGSWAQSVVVSALFYSRCDCDDSCFTLCLFSSSELVLMLLGKCEEYFSF